MRSLCSSNRRTLRLTLTASVYFMLELSTCTAGKCGLQTTEKMTFGSITIRNTGLKLCQVRCDEHCFSSNFDIIPEIETCRRLDDESKKVERAGGSSVLSKTHVGVRHVGDMGIGPDPVHQKQCHPYYRCFKNKHGKASCLKAPRRHSRRFRIEDVELLKACKYGTLDNVRQIVSRDRANVNYRGPHGLTPLMSAAQRKGMKDMIEFLVRMGADASVIDDSGDTILHQACVGADEETVKYFISQDIVDINCRGYHGRTPVMNAAEAGSVEVVKLLVSEGADLSLVDTEGSTILHRVCRRGHAEVASYILTQNRIDINARDMAGRTPLDLAKSKDMHDLLVSHGAHHHL